MFFRQLLRNRNAKPKTINKEMQGRASHFTQSSIDWRDHTSMIQHMLCLHKDLG